MLYEIISATSEDELMKKLAAKVAGGWQYQGGLSVVNFTVKGVNNLMFYQAVVKPNR